MPNIIPTTRTIPTLAATVVYVMYRRNMWIPTNIQNCQILDIARNVSSIFEIISDWLPFSTILEMSGNKNGNGNVQYRNVLIVG